MVKIISTTKVNSYIVKRLAKGIEYRIKKIGKHRYKITIEENDVVKCVFDYDIKKNSVKNFN